MKNDCLASQKVVVFFLRERENKNNFEKRENTDNAPRGTALAYRPLVVCIRQPPASHQPVPTLRNLAAAGVFSLLTQPLKPHSVQLRLTFDRDGMNSEHTGKHTGKQQTRVCTTVCTRVLHSQRSTVSSCEQTVQDVHMSLHHPQGLCSLLTPSSTMTPPPPIAVDQDWNSLQDYNLPSPG